MNLPNKLTMLRIFIVPFIIIVYLLNNVIDQALVNLSFYIMGALYVIASFTDFLDGYIARKNNIVTTFGKFMDPLADKLLNITAIILLTTIYHTENAGLFMWMPFWILIIFVTRDLVVTSIRIVAMSEGKVVAAQWSGKIRTAFTMVTVTYYFFLMPINNLIINIIGVILTSIFALLTVYSMIDYFVVNKSAILKEK